MGNLIAQTSGFDWLFPEPFSTFTDGKSLAQSARQLTYTNMPMVSAYYYPRSAISSDSLILISASQNLQSKLLGLWPP